MPFTLAHPAIVFPLLKSKRFSSTALIIGSMVPDFEFYLQLREVENIGHSWFGIVMIDFPLALMMCFLFHNVLKKAMLDNMPLYFKKRFIIFEKFNWNNYTKTHTTAVVISLLIGIVSHLLWDGFTHEDGLFVSLFPVLSTTISLFLFSMPLYLLLQILFSIVGLLLAVYWIHRMPTQKVVAEKINTIYWLVFLVFIAIILIIRLFGWPNYNSFWSVFMAVLGSITYSWIINTVLYNNYLQKK
jgi:hypothetical protein